MKLLVAIVGPTAVGKTEIGVTLAAFLQTDVISADSRQVFRELNIGTSKPSSNQLATVRHHLVNSHSILDSFDVAEFERESLKALSGIYQQHDVALLVGGSGLYIKVLCHGIDDIPKAAASIRGQLILQLESEGLASLQAELRKNDPLYYEVVDRNNPQRVIRALEVQRSSGKPFSGFLSGTRVKRPFEIMKIGLKMDRKDLNRRIAQWVEDMVNRGLFDEVANLSEYRHLNALQTVGYTEVFGFLDGKYGREEAIRVLKRNTRRYAKRQLTWFKKDSEVKWFHPEDLERIKNYVTEGNERLMGKYA